MKDSPFIYGTTVSTHSFTNREKDCAKLKSNLLNGINTTLISPRRWGKSSLVEKVITDINRSNKEYKTIVIDLFTVGTEEEFLEIFAREVIKASATKWEDWVKNSKQFFKLLSPKLTLGVDPTSEFSISFDWKEIQKNSDEILNLPEVIAQKKKIKFIICLDEFQNLASFKNFIPFEKKMRAIWQRQKGVTYCLYGSKRHMMSNLFNNPSKPFYRFGDIMLLPKIETEKWVKFIMDSFGTTNKLITEALASKIATTMSNHSWYIQQFAHYTWNLTHKKASLIELNSALKELISANTPLYQMEIESLSATQVNLLKAIANGENKLTSINTMQNYFLGTPNNVNKNKRNLIENDIITESETGFEFMDAAFLIWFKYQYFGISFKID